MQVRQVIDLLSLSKRGAVQSVHFGVQITWLKMQEQHIKSIVLELIHILIYAEVHVLQESWDGTAHLLFSCVRDERKFRHSL